MAALLLAVISVGASLGAIDFPFGTIGDEYAKVQAVTTGRTDYFHPLLMIELAQGASLIVQPHDSQSVVELGRLSGALAGGLLVFATFRLARLVLPDLAALAAAAAAAVTPLVTVHARIFKEDIFLAPLVVLALAALIGLLQAPAPRRAVVLGVLIGLAAGAKYIGAVMLPFAVAAIVLVPTPGPPRRLARALTVAGTAIATFLIVELPGLRHLARFSHGMTFEFGHSLKGHDVPLPLKLTWGVFHLSQSLLPNLGLPLLVLGLIGLAAPLIATSERRMPLVLIASFSVFWYAMHEASPLKPYPDFARYMLPLAPLLAILAASFIYELLARRDRLGIAASVMVVVAAIPALWISVRTNGAVEDPRGVIPAILAATDARVATDRYADYDTSRELLGDRLRPTEQTADIVVTSNMTYDRYDSYAARNAPVLKRPAGYYYELNALPHLDVSNGRPSRGYFNPVLRVVAMDGRVERLDQIAETIRAAAPDFDVRMVRQRPAQ